MHGLPRVAYFCALINRPVLRAVHLFATRFCAFPQILRSLKEPERDLPEDTDGVDINHEVSATAVASSLVCCLDLLLIVPTRPEEDLLFEHTTALLSSGTLSL